jgi:tetratricopeptide (TPR) repeat protein
VTARLPFAALAAALLSSPAAAQTLKIQKEVEADLRDARKQQQAEDVEIMRRLLHGALQESYGLSGLGGDVEGYYRKIGLSKTADAHALLGVRQAVRDAHVLPAPDGIYLKGSGVVYTVSLPAVLGDPAAQGAAEPKAPTAWEKARAQLRGEKAEQPRAAAPPLADALLRVLAENGKHISGLADDERIIIVVTFRGRAPAGACVACHVDPFAEPATGGPPSETGGRVGEGQPQQQPDAASAQSLGDLHFRQGKFADAVTAYTKALDAQRRRLADLAEKAATPAKAQALLSAAELSGRLAQAHLALKDTEAARKAAEAAAGWTREAERVSAALGKPARAATPALPAKLIVSVTRKALHAGGSFEDFRKAATVETVPAEGK